MAWVKGEKTEMWCRLTSGLSAFEIKKVWTKLNPYSKIIGHDVFVGGGESVSPGKIAQEYDEDALHSYTADVLIACFPSSSYLLSL